MTSVDLGRLSQYKEDGRYDRNLALNWLFDNFGPMGERWMLRELTYVDFARDKDATMFLMRWS
jgi:hypothetical protein